MAVLTRTDDETVMKELNADDVTALIAEHEEATKLELAATSEQNGVDPEIKEEDLLASDDNFQDE